MTTRARTRRVLALAAGILALAGPAQPAPTFAPAVTLPELLAAHRLVLVCRLGAEEVPEPFLQLLADLAAHFGPHGLGVAVDRDRDAPALPPAGVGVQRLIGDGAAPGRPSLALHRADGSVLAASAGDDLDLYAVYRLCERELRGRPRVSFHDHVRDVLAGAVAAAVAAVPLGADDPLPLGDLLAASSAGCLLLPPGCSGCLLDRHAAPLADLAAAAALPALVFEDTAGAELLARGWQGPIYRLPAGAEARLLALRQGGHYAPVLVAGAPDDGLQVLPLHAGGAW